MIDAFSRDELGLTYPLESIAHRRRRRGPSSTPPTRAVVDPGDKVIYPTPSWNNNHYTYLTGGVPVELVVGPETNFMPTAEMIRPHIRDARLIAVCTPLNPTGTVMAETRSKRSAELVVEENDAAPPPASGLSILMWDQVYWMLTFGENRHWAPPQLVPESAAYTIFVDGISQGACRDRPARRLDRRPARRHRAHARPPRPHRRLGPARRSSSPWPRSSREKDEIAAFHEEMIRELRLRLDALYDGLMAMRREGLPVDAIAPQGAIYLSAQFDLIGQASAPTKRSASSSWRKPASPSSPSRPSASSAKTAGSASAPARSACRIAWTG